MTALWKGIVCIERTPGAPMARVFSARVHEGGRSAIDTRLPLRMLAHYFDGAEQDGLLIVPRTESDSAYAYAELTGDPADAHLEFHERASQREFFFHPEESLLIRRSH